MITIVTGIPGAGKTLYTVSELAKEYDGREIYYYRIPHLTLDWRELENPENWTDCPDGAVIIIDEAHEAFPKRDYRKAEPEFIEAMATHRHRGMDIILVTQHPKDLDVFIRRRAGRHIHVEKPLVSSTSARVLIWPEYQEHVKIPDVRERCESFSFPYPSDAFGVYKSAEIHTKPRRATRGLVRAVAIVGIGALAFVLMGYKLFADRMPPTDTATANSGFVAPAIYTRESEEGWFETHSDRIEGLPFTAPIYDEIKKPQTYPKLLCVSSDRKCWCYTQQASRVDVPEAMCRNIVTRGYFDYSVEGA